MTAQRLASLAALGLGLALLASAPGRAEWSDPVRAPARKADRQSVAEAATAAEAGPRTAESAAAAAPAVPAHAARRTRSPAAPAADRAGRPRPIRKARYEGGQGAAWRTGRDAYGFAGTFAGCRVRGQAGPGGFRLDRSC